MSPGFVGIRPFSGFGGYALRLWARVWVWVGGSGVYSPTAAQRQHAAEVICHLHMLAANAFK